MLEELYVDAWIASRGGGALTGAGARARLRPFRKTGPQGPSNRTRAFAMHAYRTHTCGALRHADQGANVRLSGWIHRKRDHGGLTQLVADPATPGFDLLERLRAESVVRIDGEVVARSAETVNPALPTGEVEVRVRAVSVLSEAAELPLPVFGEPDYPEDVRYRYRY